MAEIRKSPLNTWSGRNREVAIERKWSGGNGLVVIENCPLDVILRIGQGYSVYNY